MTFFEKLGDFIHNNLKIKSTALKHGNQRSDNSAFLIHANSEIEASIIESKLNAYGIPVLKEYDGSGLYSRVISGSAILGAEIYVPPEFFEEAKDLILKQETAEENIDKMGDKL